jgi:ABC-type glycerol-3-phosphate transport system substrate-binding protein
MRTISWIPLCAIVLAGCGASKNEPQSPTAAAAAPPYHTTLTTKQLMSWIIDPNATAIWNSVGSTTTEKGTEEKHPQTDEQWAVFRNAAATLIESGNLLMLDGRAVDNDQWMATSRGMADAAATVLEAAEAKDVEAYFDAGGALYEACTACHSKYLVGPGASQKP